MLRLIVNRARLHYNAAVEMTAKGHYYEALGELNSGLELNAKMDEAHVLRGTILARLERFDEAREAWDRALALNPHASKASRHLKELGQAEEAIPLLRRSRGLVYTGVGALALGLLLAGGALLVPGGGGGIDPMAHQALAEARRRENALLVEKVMLLREGGAPIEAARLIADLRKSGAGSAMDRELDAQESLLREELLESYRRALLPGAGASPDAAAGLLEALHSSFPDAQAEIADIQAEADEIASLRIQEILLSLPSAEAELSEVARRLSEASALTAAVSGEDSRNRLGEAVEAAARSVAHEWLALARRDPIILDRLKLAAVDLSMLPLSSEERIALSGELARMKVERWLDRLSEAINGGELLAAHSLAVELLDSPHVTVVQQRALARERERLAAASYYELMAMGDALEGRQLTTEQAERALALVQAARGGMPARFGARGEENVTFFALRAHQLLGNIDGAFAEEQRLLQAYPESPYLAIAR